MRILHWTSAVRAMTIAALTLAAAPATAPAATRADAQVRATVRSYLAAMAARDTRRMCALVAPGVFRSAGQCRSGVDVAGLLTAHAVRIDGVAVHGSRARASVAYAEREVSAATYRRTRVVLRRAGGRWRIASTGALPGTRGQDRTFVPDPAPPGPTTTRAALARLVDDELLGLSGDAALLCHRLVPAGVPGASQDECRFVTGLVTGETDGAEGADPEDAVRGPHALWGVLRDVTPGDGGNSARLTATVTARTITHPAARHQTFALRTTTRTETLFAQRDAATHAWLLLKPSRSFYTTVGLPVPDDVDAATPGATWPVPDAAVPSLSESPLPAACRTPPLLWPLTGGCRDIYGLEGATLASGRGLVAWSDGTQTRLRPTAGAVAAGPVVAAPAQAGARELRSPAYGAGVLPVGDGALLLEDVRSASGVSTFVTPVGADGHATGPTRRLAGDASGIATVAPVAVAPGASVAAGVRGANRLERLTPAGAPAGADVELPDNGDASSPGEVALLPDGTIVEVTGNTQGVVVIHRAADGRQLGPVRTLPPVRRGYWQGEEAPSVAVDAAGHALVLWDETDTVGHALERAWVYDPAAPVAAPPVTVGALRARPEADPDAVDGSSRAFHLAGARADGSGWAIAYGEDPGPATAPRLWAGRLAPDGRVAAAPRVVATGYGDQGVALAGDAVAWVAPPQLAGVPQVRSAPLP